jgi:putative tricarboxylic transport membrane protein
MLHLWLSGLEGLLQARELLFLALGMTIGLFFGAIPGLGGATALALLTPLTYGLDPFTALALAGGVMGAVPMGGSISAILLNAPGSAPSAATCLDGHPLAQQGKAGLALGAAASANAIGGIIGTISVLAILPIAKDLVLLFGPPELFLLAVLGLIIVATASRGKMLRGLIVGVFGLMIAFIGYNDVTGVLRFTAGIAYLWDGVHLVPALIGLFAVAEMINLSVKGGAITKDAKTAGLVSITSGLLETFRHWPTVLRGSLIGTVVGAIPGVGGTVASFLSYSLTVQASKDPESFGKGNIQGVIAPEAAINAKDCSCLIPTLAFGIPGGVEMAVFMGLLVLHGMQPGPLMLIDHQVEIYGLIWALTGACVLASLLGLLVARPLSKLTLIDSQILVPVVTAVALVGSYAVDRNIGNVVVTAVFGMLGYLMIRFDYPRLTMVVALVLGSAAERNFYQTTMMSDGNLSIYLHRNVCLVLLVGIVALLIAPLVRGLRKSRGLPR